MNDRTAGVVFAMVVTLLLLGPALPGTAAPGTGRLPWNDYQELLRWQVMAPGVQPPTREYVFLLDQPLSSEAEDDLRKLGLELVAVLDSMVVVRGPLTSFAGLGPDGTSLPWVQLVLPSVPIGTSQEPAVYALRLAQLRDHLGLPQVPLTGRGVTVGVLDGGFTGSLAKELGPDRVQMLKLLWENGRPKVVEGYEKHPHGEACARGVLAVAPGANLVLLSAPTAQDRYAFLQLLAAGIIKVDVVTDSTFYPIPLDFGDGQGEFAQVADKVVERGVFYAYAIGNLASSRNTDRAFFSATFTDTDGDGSHDFTPTATNKVDRNTLEITIAPWQGTGKVSLLLALTWDGWPWQIKPEGPWTCEDHIRVQDVDLFVYFKDGARVVEIGRSERNQLGPCYPQFPGQKNVPPLEVISVSIDRPGTYLVEVRNVTVSDHGLLPGRALRNVEFKLYTFLSGAYFSLEHSTVAGSLIDLAGARRVVSVGAAGWTGTGWVVMPYSSRGPTADGRMKPELVAPTNYENPVPERGVFGGTSASAPLVAGVAALLLEANRTLSPAKLADLLMRGATPLCGGFNPPCQSGASPCGHSWSHTAGCGLLNALASYRLLRP